MEEQKQNENNEINTPNVINEPTKTVLPQQSNEWISLFADLPSSVPTAPNYNPRVPLNFTRFYITDPCSLIRRIYLHMLGAIDTYTRLLTLAPEQDQGTIRGLRSQMQVLSISMLSIGQDLGYCNIIPFRVGSNSRLPSNYVDALYVTYDRVYNIFYETLLLYDILGTNTNQTRLLIIINNLRSQLATIDDLISRNS